MFDASGKPAGTRDWPIADTLTLALSVTEGDFLRLLGMAFAAIPSRRMPHWMAALMRREATSEPTPDPVISVTAATSATTAQASIDMSSGSPAPATLTPFGTLSLEATGTGAAQQMTVSYAGSETPDTPAATVTVAFDETTDAVTLTFGDEGVQRWDPNIRTPFSAQIGDNRLSITWVSPPSGEPTLTAALPQAAAAAHPAQCDRSRRHLQHDPARFIGGDRRPGAARRHGDQLSGDRSGHRRRHRRGQRLRRHRQGHPPQPLSENWIDGAALLQTAPRSPSPSRPRPDPSPCTRPRAPTR